MLCIGCGNLMMYINGHAHCPTCGRVDQRLAPEASEPAVGAAHDANADANADATVAERVTEERAEAKSVAAAEPEAAPGARVFKIHEGGGEGVPFAGFASVAEYDREFAKVLQRPETRRVIESATRFYQDAVSFWRSLQK